MEMNAKNPFVWDWESLVMFPPRSVEVPKKYQVVDSEFEAMDGFEVGSLHSSGGRSDGISGGSASDLAYGSSSKSSKSASVDSSSNKEMRESKFILETGDCFSQDPTCGKELASAWPPSCKTSAAVDFTIGSSESMVGLKLGKRTYFEDVSASGNAKISAMVSVSGATSDVNAKSSKLVSIEVPRCQVEGCNIDLSSAKDYHRKHRVCENHSKSPKVVICGVERRFCQQCSRFHGLSEFDQKKRSCRRRLSDHNARRRKARPDVIHFNTMGLPSSLHERRNQTNLAFNQVPLGQLSPNANSVWDFSRNSKFTQEEKLRLYSPVKARGVDDELRGSRGHPEDSGFKLSFGSSQFLPSSDSKVPPGDQEFHQGLRVPATANTNMEAAQDDLRALSLLSTNSWGGASKQHKQQLPQLSHLHQQYNNDIPHSQTISLSPRHVAPMSLPPAQPVPAQFWQGNQQPPGGGLHKDGGNNHFQEFQLFKPPNEAGFYFC